MGQSTKSTQLGLPHTGRPHGRVNLAESNHDSHRRVTRACPYRAQSESNSEKANFEGF
ncbi:hypothetical protein F383_33668 [Gossypium arboreum]|uniref:Uncharacterized protein n=1 Tax=Gossypium arboreum TaxID=29729 RepID=A0A0B0N728_GOSAR|nr:hypothetical protein F383_33668 [Gossypium arboreum]